MADDWQAGDLAMCVRNFNEPGPRPEVGCVYTVTKVVFGGRGLLLEDLPCPCPGCGSTDHCASWRSTLFKKIPPRKKSATRFDFRTLLQPKKADDGPAPTPAKEKELEPA